MLTQTVFACELEQGDISILLPKEFKKSIIKSMNLLYLFNFTKAARILLFSLNIYDGKTPFVW